MRHQNRRTPLTRSADPRRAARKRRRALKAAHPSPDPITKALVTGLVLCAYPFFLLKNLLLWPYVAYKRREARKLRQAYDETLKALAKTGYSTKHLKLPD